MSPVDTAPETIRAPEGPTPGGAAVQAWRRGWWSAAHRMHFTLVAAIAATVALAAQWGLL